MEQRIKELTEMGYSQRHIAETLNVSKDTVRYWQKKLNTQPKNEMVIKQCECCGKDYKTTTNNKHSRFCDGKCRNRYRKRTVLFERECERCGKPFKTYKSKYCSNECRKLPEDMKKNLEPKVSISKSCPMCNQGFITTKTNKRYCSDSCSYQYRLNKMETERKNNAIQFNKRCKECGKHYSTTKNNSQYCSQECGKRYMNRRKETIRRKRIARNGKVDWDISIERLLKRDGHVCYLCGEHVDTKVDTNLGTYPSIDHVIPVAKGGTHTWDNVKIAHRQCNSLKRDEVLQTK